MSHQEFELEFVDIDATTCQLGWRFDNEVASAFIESLNSYTEHFRDVFFSPHRTVTIPRFSISTTAIYWGDVCTQDGEEFCEIDSLEEWCERVDFYLGKKGWRLPTEDEFELACGGDLFPWGNDVPDNYPDGMILSDFGLCLNLNMACVEVVRSQMKLGDGGESQCGGYPWPIQWLPFSPAFRVYDPEYELHGMLESAHIRPVQMRFQTTLAPRNPKTTPVKHTADAIIKVSDLMDFQRSEQKRIVDAEQERLNSLDPNLERLELCYKPISDVTPLAKLTKLRLLLLDNTQVSDVTPLATLMHLVKLNLRNTQVSDVRPLANLINLEWLGLMQTQVTDVPPLGKLVNLKRLDLADILPKFPFSTGSVMKQELRSGKTSV